MADQPLATGDRLLATNRHRGHLGGKRHQGVHHDHHAVGTRPHTGGSGHRTGHPAQHHERTARAAHLLAERGTVSSYDAGSNTAQVQLVGSLNRLIGPVPVSLGIPTVSLAGKNCLVMLLDAHNPSDAVVVAAW
ncbi:MAG TPA: hypothetical protein VKF37_18735 [Chloroflexota bacterium]|nr:hypothetical protein [Chloroflexota bacterium]